MQDERTRARTGAGLGALGNTLRVAPSSSRMFASYLADIEQLLDEQRWEAALREALDLPQIAVALSNPQLTSSADRVKEWCDQWIRPEDPDRNASGANYERVSAAVLARTSRDETATVPSFALKRLRLRRHARTPPRGFSPGRSGSFAPEGNNAIETCSILVEAARRWYAHRAVHDRTVQANLARLAVLR
jgi:hypothetical protein